MQPMTGGRRALEGACPSCGKEVRRVYRWSNAGIHEAYECPECGPSAYGGPVDVSIMVAGVRIARAAA